MYQHITFYLILSLLFITPATAQTALVTVFEQTGFGVDPEAEPAPGLDVLGYGYDVFGDYATQGGLKPYCLFKYTGSSITPIGTKRYLVPDYVALKNLSQKDIFTAEGSSREEYSQELAVKVGLRANAFFFKASVEQNFELGKEKTGKKYYYTYGDVTQKWLIQFDERRDAYKSLLEENFKQDLEEMVPFKLFEMYGTHFIFSAILGGRAEYRASTTYTQTEEKNKFKTAVKAKYKCISVGVKVSGETESIIENENTTTSLYAVGGNPELLRDLETYEAYKGWADGIEGMPVLVDFNEDSLRPIWELTENGERRKTLENAFAEYCKKFPFPPAVAGTSLKSGIYRIQNVFNQQFLDAYEIEDVRAVDPENSRAFTSELKDDDSQKWIVSRVEGDYYTIQQKSTGRLLRAHTPRPDPDEPDNYEQWVFTCSPQRGHSRQWNIKRGENNICAIQHRLNDGVVDLSASKPSSVVLHFSNKTKSWPGPFWLFTYIDPIDSQN